MTVPRVLNLTATVEELVDAPYDAETPRDVVFRLEGLPVWRCAAQWSRHDEDGVERAVDEFARRLRAVLAREEA